MQEKKQSIRDAYALYKKNPELNQDKILAVLNNYKTTWEQERRSQYDRQWRDNLAFYSGNHYVRDIGAGRGQYRVKLRENHTNNTMARMISIFVQNLPIVRIFPATASDIDVNNAESTELYGRYFWRVKKFELKLIKFIKYTTIFGNGFIYPSWNPDIGERVRLESDETESGNPEEKYYKGDIQVDIDNPFRINVRPGIEELDDMFDFLRSVPANREQLESRYGPINGDTITALNAYTGEVRHETDMVLQNHYFCKPTPWFEEGLYVCWVGNRILKIRPATKSESQLPLIHLPFDQPPMRFWGMAAIEQVMDLQEQLNRAASMIIEARNLVARPRVIAPVEAHVPGQSISDRPGDYIKWKYNPGGPPKFEVPNFNFAEMQAHKSDLRNNLADIMGITSASRGQIPNATRTALALQLVLEQDRSQYVPFIKNFYQSISDMMNRVFKLAAENLDEDDPRVIKVEGMNAGRTFHGGMVPSPLDIWLEDTNPLGWTAGARTESILELVKMQVIKDRNHVLEMLRLNNTDPAYKELKLHKSAAQRENEDLKKGFPLEIGPEDDDAIHLDEHIPFMASYEFRSQPKAVKDAYAFHVRQHKERIQGQMQQANPEQQGGIPQGAVKPDQAAQALGAPIAEESMQELLSR